MSKIPTFFSDFKGLIHLYIYCMWVAKRSIFHLLVHPPDGHNTQGYRVIFLIVGPLAPTPQSNYSCYMLLFLIWLPDCPAQRRHSVNESAVHTPSQCMARLLQRVCAEGRCSVVSAAGNHHMGFISHLSPRFQSHLHFWSNFLVTQNLAGSRWWLKHFAACCPWNRSGRNEFLIPGFTLAQSCLLSDI